ncbi:hypothetical protein Pyn_00595 [Prunus yedoensis var. nudiflora]|uniref:Beta-fructofuranosidase insoluble isoenzyme 1 n=1 Tax=Prunus yedoensis var. nudiflora TaxID=2094558 RepID=A0A314ZNT5_PRUYE|nr:hypothetical protein Pyn_00595 [Prunus yedoensis var. nudiflora]
MQTGPMYFGGLYHLFYQYNPKGAVWGNIVWAHSVSKDLINWEALEPAIYPSKPFDINGCWSGSATILPGNKPIILYTGIDTQNRQVQNYAIPANASDPYLREWIKPDNNPLVVPDVGMNATAFRDPTTAWWVDGHWKMLVGGKRKHRGVAHLYRSKDFMHWVKAHHPLHSAPHTEKDRYVPDKALVDGWSGLRYDYGNFYASKSFFDPAKSRRILLGWANESDTSHEDVAKGWAGIQADVDVLFTIPSLDKAEEFDPSWTSLDAQRLCGLKGSKVQGGLGPFGLLTLASQNLEEFTPVFFRIFKAQGSRHLVLMCSDATSSSLQNNLYKPSFAGFVDVDLTSYKKLSLRSLIDHSVVESFGPGAKTCITSRVYPTLAVNKEAHLFVFNNGTETITVESLTAWSMNAPQQMNA